jgi:hypothetical protein
VAWGFRGKYIEGVRRARRFGAGEPAGVAVPAGMIRLRLRLGLPATLAFAGVAGGARGHRGCRRRPVAGLARRVAGAADGHPMTAERRPEGPNGREWVRTGGLAGNARTPYTAPVSQ